jgi:uncharacterized protein YbbC (DUF1343 family)
MSVLRSKVKLGVECLLDEQMGQLKGARVGLLCNQASVDHQLHHVADLFNAHSEFNLTTLYGPQHGIRGDLQDNMIETPHTFDEVTGVPVYSLYSETREPTEEMLSEIDLLVCDLQDVGCRIYTFVYTLANCMRVAAKLGKPLLVCDRPNPINGQQVAGNILEQAFSSFVGQFPIPTRHGMTICELAKMFNEHWGIGCDLECVLMKDWSRDLWHDETDCPWVMPSPNIPTVDTACVFPGTVHVEGTQMSEGRGTTRPFELVGAPYIDPSRYASELNRCGLPGVYFRASYFQPTFQKHAKKTCGGVQIHVTDRSKFEPVITGVATIKVAYDLYRDQFLWKEPPYEYVHDKNPFDVIAGTGRLRQTLEEEVSLEDISRSWEAGLDEFKGLRGRFLMY